ncbi:MAG: hypothetical protein O7G84_15785, partial [Gammaproteobacteria bacterium]|nr:hypothetical protein [Gammaproteobacteria bacterium]
VEAVVSDARTYLSNPPDTPFDMIVFGLLDSHTQVSGMTSLRLDNFVYTQESFAQARDMLDPNHGLLALSFSAGYFQSPWTLRRVYRMLSESFGSPPKVMFTGYDAGVLFLSGPAARNHSFFEGDDFKFLHQAALKLFDPSEAITEPVATDDWPFLYLKHRAIPLEYWIMMALIATVSGAWVILVNRKQRIGGLSFHFFLLGGAFLLIEVRNLVAFSLMFGSTWQANNLAIGGVLIMILLANLVASRVRSLNPHVLYIVLLSILVAGVFVGPDSFQGLSRGVRLVIVPLWLSIPIFCAGLVFIRSFTRTVYTAGALGANIIGGICGGLLENVSLALGIQSLQFIASALYASSWIAMPRHADSGAQPDGGRDAAATG